MVTKDDIESELNVALDAGITSEKISSLSALGESVVREKTGCAAFSGDASVRYERAVLCYVITRLVSVDPALLKNSVSEISENGTTIKFRNGRGIVSYETEFYDLIAGLMVKSYYGGYSYTNATTFYTDYS